MNQHNRHAAHVGESASFSKSGVSVALIMVGLIVVFYLIREHWTHLGQTWPYLLLLLCPLMHLFMHDGHGHAGPDAADRNSSNKTDTSAS